VDVSSKLVTQYMHARGSHSSRDGLEKPIGENGLLQVRLPLAGRVHLGGNRLCDGQGRGVVRKTALARGRLQLDTMDTAARPGRSART